MTKQHFINSTFYFVCLFFVPPENISLIWRHHHYRWRTTNFDLNSKLMAIKQWGFLNVPHLLWHGPTLYDGHILRPLTLTAFAEIVAVGLSLPELKTWACPDRGSNFDLLHYQPTFKYFMKIFCITMLDWQNEFKLWQTFFTVEWQRSYLCTGQNSYCLRVIPGKAR